MDDSERKTVHNRTFLIGWVSYSVDRLVVVESSVLRKNNCAKKPAHRKSVKRYADCSLSKDPEVQIGDKNSKVAQFSLKAISKLKVDIKQNKLKP